MEELQRPLRLTSMLEDLRMINVTLVQLTPSLQVIAMDSVARDYQIITEIHSMAAV